MKLAVKYFRFFLEGREFIIFMDHKPLTHVMGSNSSSRLPHEDRYLRYISQFTTDIQHIIGINNTVADALSRIEAISAIDLNAITNDRVGDPELQKLRTSSSLKIEPVHMPNTSRPVYCDVSVKNRIRPFIPANHRNSILHQLHGLAY